METAGIGALIERMNGQLAELRTAATGAPRSTPPTRGPPRRSATRCGPGFFPDAAWVEQWDIAFAELYLDALDAARRGEPVPRPWAVAFGAAAAARRLPDLRLILLGMNAHINYDLPRALLAVISDARVRRPRGDRPPGSRPHPDRRGAGRRVGAEDDELAASGPVVHRYRLQPLNRAATRRLLRESRGKVWANAMALSRAAARRRWLRGPARRAGRAERRPGGGPDAAGPGAAPAGRARLRRAARRRP